MGPQLAKGVGHSQLERHVEPRDLLVPGKCNAAQVVNGRAAASNETEDPLQSIPAVAGNLEHTVRRTPESRETGDQRDKEKTVLGVERDVEKDALFSDQSLRC
jgi:hypothetical protein